MTATPWPPMWPCHKCGARGRRNLVQQGWCELHLGELFATFARDIWMTADQRIAAQLQADHDYVLTAPGDALLGTMEDWGDQLEWAIDAGTITRAEADHAWRQAVRHVAA